MAAVMLRARADLRRHWRAWLALALLVGLMGGAVTAAAAGARRTDSAFSRFLRATRAPDLFTFSSGDVSDFAQLPYEKVSRFAGVAVAAPATVFTVTAPPDAALIASTDPRVGRDLLRHKMLAGRPPRADRADEAMVSFTMAKQHHLRVGGSFRLSLSSGDPSAPPMPFTFRVVGIEASANEFPPQTGTGTNNVWASAAFARRGTGTLPGFDTVLVRLRHGARDLPAFEQEVQRSAGGKPANAYALVDQTVNTQHSIHLQAVALWLLAALLGVAGALVATQLLIRQAHLEAEDVPSLRALGLTRAQLWGEGSVRALVIGAAGGLVAAVAAVLLSPLTPVGLARTAEPHPGVAADWPAIALGLLGTATLVVAANAWPAWRAASVPSSAHRVGPEGQARPSAVAQALSRASAPVTVTAGVRLALEPGRGRTAVPVRSTLAGAAIGVVALATAFGFSASLDHLLATPRLYGVTWDARVTPLSSDDATAALPAVEADPEVAGVSEGYSGAPLTIGSVRVDAIAMAPVRGSSLLPSPVEGRLPAGPGEILLGRSTLSQVHAHIGDTVRAIVAEATPEPVPLKVVGMGVFPSLSDAMGLGKGVAMTPDGLRAMIPGGAAPPFDTLLVRFRAGVDRDRARERLQARLPEAGAFLAAAPDRPIDLVNFGRVQTLPLVLGGLLGAFAAATLTHLLVTSIRRRRRDLAVLKTLGLATRQVRATVAWQSTALSLVAVIVGIPLGMAAGRSVWLLFSHQLGIVPEPVYPAAALALLAGATVLVANLIAVLPGRAAARTSPAVVLRSE